MKEGPWVLHLTLGSNRGGWADIEGSILVSAQSSANNIIIVYDIVD